MNIKNLCELASRSCGNEVEKIKFASNGKKFLRQLARNLCLTPESYSIRFSAGGPAVSGEAILHNDNFYVCIGSFGCYWRTCKGQKDYSGGANRWVVGYGGHNNDDRMKQEIYDELFRLGFVSTK